MSTPHQPSNAGFEYQRAIQPTMPDAEPATADTRFSPQRALDWLRARLVPRMAASDRVSDELAALVEELLRADRDPDRATEKLDDWVDSRKG
ncbi:hypothetical protein [Halobacterium rubrum]|uniref:hypothetical protein n=1 Tax=Halobacterium TaxID=2239 RepID=UPI001F164DC8|nr:MULTISPECIES: hypothetical protein [Halobacterium]MDH5020899.1 hypothetical protein [Halobacterium rubrum]